MSLSSVSSPSPVPPAGGALPQAPRAWPVTVLLIAVALLAGHALSVLWRYATRPQVVQTWTADYPGRAEGRLLLIATGSCPACAAARRWLQQHAVPYTEQRIDTDPAARAFAQALDVQIVPTLLYRNTRINGWVPAALQTLQAVQSAP